MSAASQFSTADRMYLARLQQAQSQADKSLHDGEIDDRAHQGLSQQIQQRAAPLVQRQQQAQQQAEQEQHRQMMMQHSAMEAMNQQAAEYRAQNFHARVVPFIDPISRRMGHYYEEKPNVWKEMEFKSSEEDARKAQPEPPKKGA